MELFFRKFMGLKIMRQILLRSEKLGLKYMVSRVESQFTMILINSKLHIAGYKKDHYRRIHSENKVVEFKIKS